MEQRKKSLKLAARAALYQTLRKKYLRRRRTLWALECLGIAVVLAVTTVLQVYFEIKPPTYTLHSNIYNLIGESRDDTAQYLSEDKENRTFAFEVPQNDESSGDSVHTGRVADAYSASLPQNAKAGISVTDSKSQIAVSLTPKFRTAQGKKVDGDHIVYPFGSQQLIYTLKYNGLKEDIIVQKFIDDELSYDFELSLPAGVEARLDGQGNIGIYSSDPQLFGNISYGSEEDRARVEKARQNGEKTNLVMTIPYPIIKDSTGQEYTDRAYFELGEKEHRQSVETASPNLPASVKEQMKRTATKIVYPLTITAQHLRGLSYPISIDPTMQITAAGDFNKVTLEGGTQVDYTNNLIRRQRLTGAVTGSWSGSSTFTTARERHATVVAKGFLYVIAGGNAGALNTVYYAPLDTGSGAVGSFIAGTSLPANRMSPAVAYAHERIYIMGGSDGSAGQTTVYYNKINDNGTMEASWTSSSNQLNSSRAVTSGAYYNGKLYVTGGASQDNLAAATIRNNVEYASINADGSVGTWTQDSDTFTTARAGHATYVYNGYLYIAGGADASNHKSDVQYSKIASDGSIGSWITGTSLTTGRSFMGFAFDSGYLYMLGGCISGTCGSGNWTTEVTYSQLNADGSNGTWRTSTVLSSSRGGNGASTFNGYLYTTGGCITSNGTSCTARMDTAQVASFKSAGEVNNSAWSSGGNISAVRQGHGTVILNGYIYAIGGHTSGASASTVVDYAPLNSNGSIGTWSTTTTLPGGRHEAGVVAYNGYIYVIGGCSTLSSNVCSNQLDTTYYAAPTTSGTISSWGTDSTNPLTSTRIRMAAVAYDGYIYVAGDSVADSSADDVEYAQINTSDSSLNSWTQLSGALSANRSWASMTAHNGYLYLTGGADSGGSRLSTVQYSSLSSHVPQSSWSNTASLNTNRSQHTSTIWNGYLYVAGGDTTSGTATTTVEFSRIKSDGTLDTWASTQSLANDHIQGSGASANGVLYVVAGRNNSGTYQQYSEYQFINNGGDGRATWSTDSTGTLATARYFHTTLAALGRIYVVGGCTNTASCINTTLTSVESAPVNDDGTLGSWRAETSLPAGRVQQGTTVYNGYIYVTGGYNSGAGQTTNYYAKLNTSDGTLLSDPDGAGSCATTWCTQTSFANFHVAHRNVVVNGYLYAVGGSTGDGGEAVVRYASISSSDGSLGSWSNTTSLPAGRSYAAVSVYRNIIYVVGGSTTNTTFYNTTFYTTPSGNGTISAWSTSTQLLNNARHSHVGVILNGYIYVSGGWNGTALVPNTEYAPILSSGEIGPWQRTADLPEGRDGVSGAVWNGTFYSPAGNNNGTLRNTTHHARLSSISRSGSLSKLFDFDVSVTPTKFITRGSKQTGATVSAAYSNNFTCNNTAFDNSNSVSDLTYGGAGVQNITLGRTQARCLTLRYTIDDTLSAVFPDSGNETTITDFDVYFDANPGRRLRGGRTFTNGADRGLDAAP